MGKEGFANAVVNAAGTLIRRAIQSVNFIAGVSGWQITRDGDAEFNDVTMRGQLEVGTSPNPRFVIGSDIPPQLVAASADFDWDAAFVTWMNATEFTFECIGTYVPTGDAMAATGTYNAVTGLNFSTLYQNNGQLLLLNGSTAYNPTAITWIYRNGRFELASNCPLLIGSNAYKTTGIGSIEGWHAFPFNLALGVPWTNEGGGAVTFQYMLTASPVDHVVFTGTLIMGTKADNTVIGTLPVGYRPASVITIPVGMNPATPGTTTPLLQVRTNGDIACFGMTAVPAGSRVYMDSKMFSLYA